MKAFLQKILLFSLLSFFSLFSLQQVYATSQQAYQDYLYQYDLYRQGYSAFSTAKTEYQKFGSLQAQATAIDKTKTMLTQRNSLLTAYLSLLNEKLNEDRGLRASEKSQYQGMIRTEQAFLDSNSRSITTIGSLDDAETVSGKLQTQYPAMQVAIRQILVGIALGQLATLHVQYDATLTQIRDLIGANATQFDTQKQAVLNRWLLQIDAKRTTYQQKYDAIALAASNLGKENDDVDRQYEDITKLLADAKQLLTEGSAYMQEVLTAIKYKQ